MKTKAFLFVSVFAFYMFSCNGEKPDLVEPPEEPEIEIPQPPVEISEKLVFSGNDIVSFNMTTEAVIFSDSIFDILTSDKRFFFQKLTLYINGEPLLNSIPIATEITSNPFYGHIVFHMCISDSTYYFENNTGEEHNKVWDSLMKYFNDTGKMTK